MGVRDEGSVDNGDVLLQRCCDAWQVMERAGISLAALQAFYARYKYLVMSRDIASYQAIGALLANADRENLSAVGARLHELITSALRMPATRGGDSNALLHICGYLKHQLPSEEKRALLDLIEKYRVGEIEFDVPAELLRTHFQRFPHPYIEQQVFLYR